MRHESLHIIACVFSFFVFSYGCASYKPMELPDLEPEFAPYSETIEDVTLACKALTENECKRFFDRDIIGKGFQPVQMAIVNNSDRYMLFSTDGVSLTV